MPPARSLRAALERIGLGALTTLIGINLWTGAPMLSLWIGSHATGGKGLSAGGVFVVVIVLCVLLYLGVKALTRLSAIYDRVTGRPPPKREPAPWMRSMREERIRITRRGRQLNAVERIVIACVVLAVVAFEFWFFFLAGSSLPRST